MSTGQCRSEQVWTDKNLSTMDSGMYMIYFISNGTTLIPESSHSNNAGQGVFVSGATGLYNPLFPASQQIPVPFRVQGFFISVAIHLAPPFPMR
jgi:hypothetical protein